MTQGNHVSSGPNRAMVDIRVDLETLTGLTENPGELAGFGPVIADIARRSPPNKKARNGGGRWSTKQSGGRPRDHHSPTHHRSETTRLSVLPVLRLPRMSGAGGRL
ncbi:MAG: hypothetical protein O6650_01630 [Actinobacteria bacterium]|nr:hypothetical protein [Actinomycetota bacterium]